MTSPDLAIEAFEAQCGFCEKLGSPFTARILKVLGEDIGAGGLVADLLRPFKGEPIAAALALRVAGAFHRRALDDPKSRLASLYPTCGGDGGADIDDKELQALLLDDLRANNAHYKNYLKSPPQTNEVGRSGVMIGGYLAIAAQTGLPLDVCEIGASAGLNLGFDQFYYELGGKSYGDPTSPVKLSPDWHGAPPPVEALLSVRSRHACDIAPLDVDDDEAQRRLESYIWGDQLERLARLRGAISLARTLGIKVAAKSAEKFVEDEISSRRSGGVLVIAHTIMWQYMPEDMRNNIEAMIVDAGAKTSMDAPIAWLRMEPKDVKGLPTLQLTMWPEGKEQDLAVAHPHGASLKWL
jgi:hypothetical protein